MSTRFSLRAANGQEYPITGPFRIGREPECQIQIDNNLISRIHASIWIDHDHLLLRDERSRNGTQLNGQPLVPGEAHYLHHDDEVRVGDTILMVVTDPPYPRQRQHPGQPEDEPPPTAHLDKPGSAPAPVQRWAPPPPGQPAAPGAGPARATAEAPMPMMPARFVVPPSPAPPRRSRAVPLMIGGCLALLLLSVCCALGLFAATAGGPALLTALAPPARHDRATPSAPSAAEWKYPPTPQPAAKPVAANNKIAAALGAQPRATSSYRSSHGHHLPANDGP